MVRIAFSRRQKTCAERSESEQCSFSHGSNPYTSFQDSVSFRATTTG
jgi:hypothetical protein